MVDVSASLLVGIAATFVPLLVGLLVPKAVTVKRKSQRVTLWLVAGASGMMFWSFIDVMGDATQLDINQGFGTGLGDYTHLVLALMFAGGVGLMFGLELFYSRSKSPDTDTSRTESSTDAPWPGEMIFAVAVVAAIGVGFHALGEGVYVGSSLPNAPSVLDAIGGTLPGIAYILHKGLEGFVIGVFAVLARATSNRNIGILAAVSGVPTVIGFFIGIGNRVEPTYFFALGAAEAVYVEMKLVPLFSQGNRVYASIVPFLLGFYAMYIAGLFHS